MVDGMSWFVNLHFAYRYVQDKSNVVLWIDRNGFNSYATWLDHQQHSRFGGPSGVTANGDLFWHQRGQYHRVDGKPAHIAHDGTLRWHRRGHIHRPPRKGHPLPAVIRADGGKEYRIKGMRSS